MPIFKKKESSLKTPSEQEDLDVLNCVRRTKDCGMPSDIDEIKESDKECVNECKKKYYGLRRLGEDVYRLGKQMQNATKKPFWSQQGPNSSSSTAGGSTRRSRGKKSKSKTHKKSKSKTHKKSKSKYKTI